MIHYVHVVEIDRDRAAAGCKAFLLVLGAWLAWNFLPEGWSALDGWLGGWPASVWHAVTLPFVWLGSALRLVASALAWVVGAVDSAFRLVATVQAVLLPVWAVLAGRFVGRSDEGDGLLIWMLAAGFDALCAALLGYPMMADWLAAALAAGLSAWGVDRYGSAFVPVCWPLVPLSWCCLALGAAYGVSHNPGGRLRDRGAARMLVLASAMALSASGPLAADAARAAGFLAGPRTSASTLPGPATAAPASLAPEAATDALPVHQPTLAGVAHRNASGAKAATPSQPKNPRT